MENLKRSKEALKIMESLSTKDLEGNKKEIKRLQEEIEEMRSRYLENISLSKSLIGYYKGYIEDYKVSPLSDQRTKMIEFYENEIKKEEETIKQMEEELA